MLRWRTLREDKFVIESSACLSASAHIGFCGIYSCLSLNQALNQKTNPKQTPTKNPLTIGLPGYLCQKTITKSVRNIAKKKRGERMLLHVHWVFFDGGCGHCNRFYYAFDRSDVFSDKMYCLLIAVSFEPYGEVPVSKYVVGCV